MLRNKWFYILLFNILSSCQLPPASYVLYTPLNFSCSTDYGDYVGQQNAEIKATWSDSCAQSTTTWLRFSIYANQSGVSGFVFYRSTDTNPSYSTFQDLIAQHIVNKQILPLDNIVPYIYSDETSTTNGFCNSTDSSGVDRGQSYPSVYVSANPIIKYTSNSSYAVSGTTGMRQRQTSIIIPPLECLGTGAFVVTTVDYINKAESHASNILKLS